MSRQRKMSTYSNNKISKTIESEQKNTTEENRVEAFKEMWGIFRGHSFEEKALKYSRKRKRQRLWFGKRTCEQILYRYYIKKITNMILLFDVWMTESCFKKKWVEWRKSWRILVS